MAEHSDWSPSSMGRILSCPASAEVVKLYKNEDSEASNLGTIAHGVMEDCVTFGTAPHHPDIEIVEGVELALEHITQLEVRDAMIYCERRLTIPDTPVWGTADIVAVSDKFIEIADYKHGYLPVEVKNNAQLLSYLTAAIAEFGERPRYRVTVIQPRYRHIDGPIRSWDVTQDDLDFYASELRGAMAQRDRFTAGKHCKYCPARGACKTFAKYLVPFATKALEYEMTGKHAISDETLAGLVDMADLLPGAIKEWRAEAMRRTFADRRIGGFKVVMADGDRKFNEEAEKGLPALYEKFGIPVQALYEARLVSPATAEKHVKATFKGKRGAWKEPWAEVEALITRQSATPSLVRDIDGRPAFKRGMEFDELADDETEDLL